MLPVTQSINQSIKVTLRIEAQIGLTTVFIAYNQLVNNMPQVKSYYNDTFANH